MTQTFILAGTLLLCFSLVLAWLLSTLIGIPGLKMFGFIRSNKAILQAHIDYILMAIILYIFALSGMDFPPVFAYAAIVGAITNPMLFLVMAVNPQVEKSPFSIFGIVSVLSFIVTTVGMAGCALHWAGII